MDIRSITWLIIGVIMAGGAVYLTAVGQLSTEVFAALAGVALTAIFEEQKHKDKDKALDEAEKSWETFFGEQQAMWYKMMDKVMEKGGK